MNTITESQRRVLFSLATLGGIAPSEKWQSTRSYNGNTLYALERRGLVETRASKSRFHDFDVRITEQGRAALEPTS